MVIQAARPALSGVAMVIQAARPVLYGVAMLFKQLDQYSMV